MNGSGPSAPGRQAYSEEHAAAAWALLRTLTRALTAVAVLAMTFTAVNVTLLAVRHGVPWPTALLLDPMLALALATCLTVDARLAELGAAPPGWAVALRWFAGLAAWILNIWESLWPATSAHGIGVPRDADVTGVVLHSVPPALLVLLAEAVAAYRRRIHRHTASAYPTAPPPDLPPTGYARRVPYPAQPAAPLGPVPADAPPPAPQAPHDTAPRTRPHPKADPDPGAETDAPPGEDPLYPAALAIDHAARNRTGRPATIRALRTELHVGQNRARALRRRLDDPPVPAATNANNPPEQAT